MIDVAGETTNAPGAPRSLWRNGDYMVLWGGQLVSSFGTQAAELALPLLILALTKSPAQAGLLNGLRGLAFVFFGLPAGALVDRWDRRWVMVCCDIIRALAFASIPLALVTGHLTSAQLYAVSFIEGTGFIFFGLAETACLRRVVATEQLSMAVAQNQATEAASSLVGPPLGGVLFSVARSLPFVADALSYGVSVISIFFIRTRFSAERTTPRQPMLTEIKEGVVWLWRQPMVRFLMWLNGGVNLIYGGYTLLLISLAQRQGASSTAIGVMFAITGTGTIIGSLASPWLQRRFTIGQLMIGLMWIFAATWPPFVLAPNFIWLGVVNAVGFLFVPVYIATHFTYRIMLIPDALQGRVNSAFRLVTFASQSLGFVLTGLLIQWINPVWTVWVTFVPGVIMALYTTFNARMRHAGRVGDAAVIG